MCIADIFFNMFKHLSTPSELLWNRSLEFWTTWITKLRPSKPSNSGHPGPSHKKRASRRPVSWPGASREVDPEIRVSYGLILGRYHHEIRRGDTFLHSHGILGYALVPPFETNPLGVGTPKLGVVILRFETNSADWYISQSGFGRKHRHPVVTIIFPPFKYQVGGISLTKSTTINR